MYNIRVKILRFTFEKFKSYCRWSDENTHLERKHNKIAKVDGHDSSLLEILAQLHETWCIAGHKKKRLSFWQTEQEPDLLSLKATLYQNKLPSILLFLPTYYWCHKLSNAYLIIYASTECNGIRILATVLQHFLQWHRMTSNDCTVQIQFLS